MQYPKLILLVDNDPNVLHAVKFNLEMANYTVLTANSLESAKRIIHTDIFHLAIIDVRLEHEDAVEDRSGFDVARILPKDIPFIVFTAYEDKENIRQAYKNVGASELINKQDGEAAFKLIQKVDQLFAQANLNLNLQILGSEKLDTIARTIKVSGWQFPPSTEDDVRYILQKLFHEASAVHVSFLLSSDTLAPTQAGSVLLKVRPKFEAGWGASLVVKLCFREEVESEAINYSRIKPYVGGHRFAVLEACTFSRQIGALVYRLIGAQERDGAIYPLSDVFLSLDSTKLAGILRRFFEQSFATLLSNATRDHLNLTELYTTGLHLTVEKLHWAVQEFRPEALTEPYLKFPPLERKFLNPVLWSVSGQSFREFSFASHKCLVHGDLHSQNILVDADDHFWLIDFARVSESHALRDFAELETDIKFNLLRDEVDPNILLAFEYGLMATDNFSDVAPQFRQGSSDLIHAYDTIVSLRKTAQQLIHLGGSMEEYYTAVLFHTLNLLRFKHIRLEKKEHALLSAALICERLRDWPTGNVC